MKRWRKAYNLITLVNYFFNVIIQIKVITFNKHNANIKCLVFQKNCAIEELNLGWNGFSLEGCIGLGEALGCNHSLMNLDLTNNRINNEHIKNLIGGLQKNNTLETLKVKQR